MIGIREFADTLRARGSDFHSIAPTQGQAMIAVSDASIIVSLDGDGLLEAERFLGEYAVARKLVTIH